MDDGHDERLLLDKGYRFIGMGSDTGFLASGIAETLKKVKG